MKRNRRDSAKVKAQEKYRRHLVGLEPQRMTQPQIVARAQPSRIQKTPAQSVPVLRSVELLHPLLPDLDRSDIEISVIFGTYNRFLFLKRCVESVRKACEEISFEIVVTDGGSKDETVQWLQAQPDVVYIAGDLSGAVPAFNAASKRARGNFVLTLNDDAELHPLAVVRALAEFQDPLVGQVAFAFQEHGQLKIDTMFGVPYANFGMVRTNIVRAVERITGGIWAPCYRTYGGDNELSCWVYRLGYKLVPLRSAQVIHRICVDILRKNNVKQDRERHAFSKRWQGENLKFRGLTPSVSLLETKELACIEMGEDPQERWHRLSDPVFGELPSRSSLKPESVLHWQLWTNEDPQTSMVAGLQTLGSKGFEVVKWTTIDRPDRGRVFVETMKALRPTVAFLQCQDPTSIPVEALREVRQDPKRNPALVLAVWSGDIGPGKGPWVGSKDDWQYEIAAHVDVMLFTGTGQVQHHRARGMKNAAYLQIGYDTDRYYESSEHRSGIVFMGQNYGPHFNSVPGSEAQLRRDMVNALRPFPGFVPYGSGFGATMSQGASGNVYRKSLGAISISLVSDLGRYTSDRLLRSMACGAPTFVKRFDDMKGLGLLEDVNCIGWDTPSELVEKLRSWTSRRDELLQVGKNGAELMRAHHTWFVRMQELQAILNALRKQP